jgi:hypothetical protein
MKTLLASILLVTACTSGDSKTDGVQPMAASDVQFDTAASGLTSTNVQDALDDVIAMAQAQEDRAAHSTIICKYATANLPLPESQTITPHSFTAAECGGSMPDASYIGALASFETCTHELKGINVMNAGETDGPGFVIRKAYTVSSFDCTGPANVTVVFYKR